VSAVIAILMPRNVSSTGACGRMLWEPPTARQRPAAAPRADK
jgi:hypothetical protein